MTNRICQNQSNSCEIYITVWCKLQRLFLVIGYEFHCNYPSDCNSAYVHPQFPVGPLATSPSIAFTISSLFLSVNITLLSLPKSANSTKEKTILLIMSIYGMGINNHDSWFNLKIFVKTVKKLIQININFNQMNNYKTDSSHIFLVLPYLAYILG